MELRSQDEGCRPGRYYLPHLQPYLSRPRLQERLLEGLNSRITLVCAGAGFGKTTALHEFASSCPTSVAWLPLSKLHRDPARFLRDLAHVLRDILPGLGKRALELVEDGHQPSVGRESVGALLAEEFARVGEEELAVVLDDYQNVNASDIVNGILSDLVADSPPRLHLYIGSRSVPRIQLARLRADRELVEISEQDLAFTSGEAADLLWNEQKMRLSDRELATLLERTEGWIAGLVMAIGLLRRRSAEELAALLQSLAGSAWAIYDYLAEEAFNDQDPVIQSFLTRTSILEWLSPPVCDAVTRSDDSRDVLLYLENHRLFTSRVDIDRNCFRYHQLFRGFLREKLRLQATPEEIRGLHSAAADYLLDAEDFPAAIHHCVQADLSSRAADLVEKIGLSYLEKGQFETLEHWLETLPESEVASRPWLVTIRGRLWRLRMDYDEAVAVLARARVLFHEQGNNEGEGWALGEIGLVNYYRERYQDAIGHIETALRILEPSTPLGAHFLCLLAWMRCEAGTADAAVSAGEQALQACRRIAARSERLRTTCRALRLLAYACDKRGDLDRAVSLLERALQVGSEDEIGRFELTWVHTFMGIARAVRGEDELALQSLSNAQAHAGIYNRVQQQLVAWWRGNVYRDRGDLNRAAECYHLADRVAQTDLAFLLLLDGKTSEGYRLARRLHTRLRGSESVSERGGINAVLGIAESKIGIEDAILHFSEAERIFEESGFLHHLASVRAHHASFLLALGQEQKAREMASKVLEQMENTGARHLYWWDASALSFLFRQPTRPQPTESPATPISRRSAESFHLGSAVGGQLDASGRLLLSSCSDPVVRDRLLAACRQGALTLDGLAELRKRYDLTWREIEVFMAYCLGLCIDDLAEGTTFRARCARTLGMSENTLKCHVTRIRDKTQMGGVPRSPEFWSWAQSQGVVASGALPLGLA